MEKTEKKRYGDKAVGQKEMVSCLYYIAPPGERPAARGHGYATDEQNTTNNKKIYVFYEEIFGDGHKKP